MNGKPTDPRLEHRLAVLMFTDLLDSSSLKVQFGDLNYATKIARPHNELFRATLARFPGAREINNTGDGFFASFQNVGDAVEMALLFHHALRVHPWQAGPVQARIGIHLGETVILADGGDAGLTIAGHAADMCARLMSLGSGGQTLLTRHAFDDARQYVRAHPALPEGGESPALAWAAHGPYLFKGKDEPMEVFEVGAVGSAPLKPPPDAEKARRAVRPGEEETLGWRPAQGVEVPGRPGWQLVRKLGEGGFGEVWLAEQWKMKDHRVFKFCFDEERLRSFKRELTFFRLIRDALGERDDIARLYDVKLDAPPFFLESEFAEHGNLVEWCERQGGIAAVPLPRRLDILARVAEAVAAAHSIGILHKDIKPQNVLMQARGGGDDSPQLTDFGIGALADRGVLAAHEITAAGFTMMTLAEGKSSSGMTRLYAPPEQLSGKPYTVQGDVYALGVVLYQLIVGDFSRALAPGWERDIEDELLREDLAACVDGDPARRLPTPTELATRLRTLEERREARDRSRRQAERNVQRRRMARVSIGAAVLAALGAMTLGVGYVRERGLRQRADEAERQRTTEERQRLADRKQFAPALVEAARFLIARRDFDAARMSVEQAAEYDPALAAAFGLKAALLAEKEDYAGAAAVLANPACQDAPLLKLRNICLGAETGSRPDSKAMGEVFDVMGLPALAASYFARAGAHVEAALAKIEATWPRAASACSVLPSGKLRVNLSSRSDVTDLAALNGLPIEELEISRTRVKDLTPLKGMALREIHLDNDRIGDLSPLRGMPLRLVSMNGGVPVRDISPLSASPLVELQMTECLVADLSPLRKVPLGILKMNGCRIQTLEDLRGMALKTLCAANSGISDLAPLQGLPLTTLDISENRIEDLSPLAAMKLNVLQMNDTRVSDISVLRSMPLRRLDLRRTRVVDISPLAEAPLSEELAFFPEVIQTGMDALRANARIKAFRVRSSETMVPAEFWKRYEAGYF